MIQSARCLNGSYYSMSFDQWYACNGCAGCFYLWVAEVWQQICWHLAHPEWAAAQRAEVAQTSTEQFRHGSALRP